MDNFNSLANNTDTILNNSGHVIVNSEEKLIKSNYLSEFKSVSDKARARDNLNIKDLEWGNIEGDIQKLSDLIDYINNNNSIITGAKVVETETLDPDKIATALVSLFNNELNFRFGIPRGKNSVGIEDSIFSITAFIFKASETEPDIPLGGSWDANANMLMPPFGWENTLSDVINPQGLPIWMSTKLFNNLEAMSDWSRPVRITGDKGEAGADGSSLQFIYKVVANESERPWQTPDGYGKDDYTAPEGWTNHPLGVDQYNRVEYMCSSIRDPKTGKWSEWLGPMLWSNYGMNGMDGDGIKYAFKRSKNTETSDKFGVPTVPDIQGNNVDEVPDLTWSDEPQGVNEDWPYEWVTITKYKWNSNTSKKEWSKWSLATIWSSLGLKGENGNSSKNGFIFTASKDVPERPIGGIWSMESNHIINLPYNWKENPDEFINVENLPIWMSTGIFNALGQLENGWSTPIKITGDNGEPGKDGLNMLFAYRLVKAQSENPKEEIGKPKSFPRNDYTISDPIWTNHPTGVNATYKVEYMCYAARNLETNEWSDWSDATIWSVFGEKGIDGDGVKYAFRRTKIEANPGLPIIPGTGENTEFPLWEEDSPQPEDWWTDNTLGVSEEYPYEWVTVSKYKQIDGIKLWTQWSAPTLWATYGKKGDNGISGRNAFIYTIALNTPDVPVGGFWNTTSNIITDLPAGWYNNPDEQENPNQLPIWMSTAIFDEYGKQLGNWSRPVRITGKEGDPGADGNNIQFAYKLVANKMPIEELKKPITIPNGNYTVEGNGWTDHPIGVDIDHKAEYMCYALKSLNSFNWGQWSEPTLWSSYGEQGVDGDGVKYAFKRSKSKDPQDPDGKPIISEISGVEEVPDPTWTDNPKGIDNVWKFEWVSKTKYCIQEDGTKDWTNWSEPTLWASFGEKGADGESIQYIYHVYDTEQYDLLAITPKWTPNSNYLVPGDDGWTNHPTGVTDKHLFEYACSALKINGQWEAWRTAFLWSHYGINGLDGDGVKYAFSLETNPVNPQGTGADEYPTGPGVWTADPQGVSIEHPIEWVVKSKYNGATKEWGPWLGLSKWAIYGGKQLSGIIFKPSSDTPEIPKGGNFDVTFNVVNAPEGWQTSDEPNPSKLPLWMCQGFFTELGDLIYWGNPVKISGKDGENGVDSSSMNFIYRRFNEEWVNPTIPEGRGNLKVPDNINGEENWWTDHPQGVDITHQYEYMSYSTKEENIHGNDIIWSTWSTPVLWAKYGVNGTDGDGVKYAFIRSKTDIIGTPDGKPADPLGVYGNSGETPYPSNPDWTDDPKGVDNTYRFEWVTTSKYADHGTGKKSWGLWSKLSAWAVYGVKGKDGISPNTSFKSTAFCRTNDNIKYDESWWNSGDYFNPLPNKALTASDNYILWTDGVPNGSDLLLWMTTRIFSSDGEFPQQEKWSRPLVMTDTTGFDVEFSAKPNPAPPVNHPNTNKIPNGDWSDTSDSTTIWMATSSFKNGKWSEWQISKIKGEKGEDGTSIKIKQTFKSREELHVINDSKPQINDSYVYQGLDDVTSEFGDSWDTINLYNGHLYIWTGSGWVDAGRFKGDKGDTGADGQDGSSDYLHIKYAKRINPWELSGPEDLVTGLGKGELPSEYIGTAVTKSPEDPAVDLQTGKPYIWKKWTGQDGFGYEYIYIATKEYTAPFIDNDTWKNQIVNGKHFNDYDFVPKGWSDNPIDASYENPYIWVAYRRNMDKIWGNFIGSTKDKNHAALWAKYGIDGDQILYAYCRTNSIDDLPSPKIPNSKPNDDFTVLSPWTNHPQGVKDETGLRVEWIISARKVKEQWKDWDTMPIVWSAYGTKGQDGDGIKYAYYRTKDESSKPKEWENWPKIQGSDDKETPYPITTSSWRDDPLGISATLRCEYVSMVKKDKNGWGFWTAPKLWAKYGDKGDPGLTPVASFKSTVFCRTNKKPSIPTGGTYLNPIPVKQSNLPTWTDGIPSNSEELLWASTRIFYSDDSNELPWSIPSQMTDTTTFDVEFSNVSSPKTPSLKTNHLSDELWHIDNPQWANEVLDAIWMATCTKTNGVWSKWQVSKIKGEKGDDGTSLNISGELLYRNRSQSSDPTKTLEYVTKLPPKSNDAYIYVGENNDGNPSSRNAWESIPLVKNHLYVWDGDNWIDVGQFKGESGKDGISLYIHIKYAKSLDPFIPSGNNGEDPNDFIGICVNEDPGLDPKLPEFKDAYTWSYIKGLDGFGYEYIYKVTSTYNAPEVLADEWANLLNYQNNDFVPDNWTDNPIDVSSTNKYCWVSYRIKDANGKWGKFRGSDATKNSPKKYAALFAKYGSDGSGIQYAYCLTESTDVSSVPKIQGHPNNLYTVTLPWTNNPSGVSNKEGKKVEWVVVSKYTDLKGWEPWSDPKIWSTFGVLGQDGAGMKYAFRITNTSANPGVPVNPGDGGNSEFPKDPKGNTPNWWTAEPSETNEEFRWEWVTISKFDGTKWSPWGTPTLWSNLSVAPSTAFKSTVFCRTNSIPNKPEGGDYEHPIPTLPGTTNSKELVTWTDNIPDGESILWASTRIFSRDTTDPFGQAEWSIPSLMTDTSNFDVEFSSELNPNSPNPKIPGLSSDLWHAANPHWSNTSTKATIWMATSVMNNGNWTKWLVSKIKGEDGKDGTSLKVSGEFSSREELKTKTSTAHLGDAYVYTGEYSAGNTDGQAWEKPNLIKNHLYVFTGDGWADTGQFKGDKGEPGQSQWIHIRYAESIARGNFVLTNNKGKEPGKYIGMYISTLENGEDPDPKNSGYPYKNWTKWIGEDGWGYEYIYISTIKYEAPSLLNETWMTSSYTDAKGKYFLDNDFIPKGGWVDNPIDTSYEHPYIWVAYRKFMNGTWSKYVGSSTNPNKASLWAKYGKDGNELQYAYCRTNSVTDLPSPLYPSSLPLDNFEIQDSVWTNHPLGVEDVLGHRVEWVTTARKVQENWENWNQTPKIWSVFGKDGKDGDGFKYAFRRLNTYPYPDKDITGNQSSEGLERPNVNWSDNVEEVNSANKYQYVTTAKFTNGKWGNWSVPKLWNKYTKDGITPNTSFKSTAFCRTNKKIQYDSSWNKSGNYNHPIPSLAKLEDGSFVTWSDGIPEGNKELLWATTRIFTNDGKSPQQDFWTKPVVMADTSDFDVEFSSNPNPPLPKGHPINSEDKKYWSSTAKDNTIWMATSVLLNGVWSEWSKSKIKGESGKDGTSINPKGVIHSRAELLALHPQANDAYVYSGKEDLSGTPKLYPNHLYVWNGSDSWIDLGEFKGEPGKDGVSQYMHIKYSVTAAPGISMPSGGWETPSNYMGICVDDDPGEGPILPGDKAKYTWQYCRGVDGFGYEYIYTWTSSNIAPNVPSTSENRPDYIPSGNWSDNPFTASKSRPYIWVCYRKYTNNAWGKFTGSNESDGTKCALFTKWVEDGLDSSEILYAYRLSDTSVAKPNCKPRLDYIIDDPNWSNHPQGVADSPNKHKEYMSYAKSNHGDWSKSEWSTPVIWSSYGVNGKDGDGIEYAFYLAANESEAPKTGPTAIIEDNKPSILLRKWVNNPQGVSFDYTCEWVSIKKTGLNVWSKPSLWSKYAKDGQDGNTGPQGPIGNRGPQGLPGEKGPGGLIIYPAGVWKSDIEYTFDAKKAPYVWDAEAPNEYNTLGSYYVLIKSPSIVGTAPHNDAIHWEAFKHFDTVYADVGIFGNALVGSAVFNKDYMFSQYGYDAANDTYNYNYEKFDPDNKLAFIPSIELDLKKGYAHFSKGKVNFKEDGSGLLAGGNITWNELGELTVTGEINADSGNIGGFVINPNELNNINPESKLIIGRDGGRFFRVNDSTGSVVSIRGDNTTALSLSGYGVNTMALSIIANVGSYAYNGGAIDSIGNVTLTARDNERIKIKGLALNVRKITGSETLKTSDDFIILENRQWADITFPNNASPGKIIYIKLLNGVGYTCKNAKILAATDNRFDENYTLSGKAHMVMFIHMGLYNTLGGVEEFKYDYRNCWCVMNAW